MIISVRVRVYFEDQFRFTLTLFGDLIVENVVIVLLVPVYLILLDAVAFVAVAAVQQRIHVQHPFQQAAADLTRRIVKMFNITMVADDENIPLARTTHRSTGMQGTAATSCSLNYLSSISLRGLLYLAISSR